MRRGRIFIIFAIILIGGLALVLVLGRQFLFPTTPVATGEVVAETPTPVPTVATQKVVVVTQKVQRGEALAEDKLDLVEYPLDLILTNMFTDIDEVVGQVARYDMEPYTVVTSALVSDKLSTNQGSDAALFIKPGMVAVSIPIDRLSAVSYAPRRGDHVNVIVTVMFVDVDTEWQSELPNAVGNVIAPRGGGVIEDATTSGEMIITILAQPYMGPAVLGRPYEDTVLEETFYTMPSETQRPRLVSQTLIQDVIVLQMGEFPMEEEEEEDKEPTPTLDPSVTPAPSPTPLPVTPEAPPPPPDVITLIVSPQDAVTLNYLIFSGAELTLALRHPQDTNTALTEAVTLDYLVQRYSVSLPVKLPYALDPRIDEVPLDESLMGTPTPTPEG